MPSLQEIPEHILHQVVSENIASTQSRGWQFSLRLINRQFNEAVLHVFFLQKRYRAICRYHTIDCIKPCPTVFCRTLPASRPKEIYAMRFNLQSMLAIQDSLGEASPNGQLVRQWKAALQILRGGDNLEQLGVDQLRLYSTCTSNPIFNDIASAILSEALNCYLENQDLIRLAGCRGTADFEGWPPAFWVALSACVLGHVTLFESYLNVSNLMPLGGRSSSSGNQEPFTLQQHTALLTAAIKHMRIRFVHRLLQICPTIISEGGRRSVPLHTAIFSQNNEILKAVLKYTPRSSDFLTNALFRYRVLLPQSTGGSETIRLLTEHFTPLCPESRGWLITHSCAVGDVTLLEEFSKSELLFSHRIYPAPGIFPTDIHFAFACGNVDSLRFLLDHGSAAGGGQEAFNLAIEKVLSFNQIECYREMFKHISKARDLSAFPCLALAENAENDMAGFISEHGSVIFDQLRDDPPTSLAQLALWNAIQRLRPDNARFLLDKGASALPLVKPNYILPIKFDHPLDIPWPYFNLNRDAFLRTQAVLDAYGLPKLRIIV